MSLDGRIDRAVWQPGDEQKPLLSLVADHPQTKRSVDQPHVAADPATPGDASKLALSARKQYDDAIIATGDQEAALSSVKKTFEKSIEFADKLGIPAAAEARQELAFIDGKANAADAKRTEADGYVNNALGMIPKAVRDGAKEKLDAYDQAGDDAARQQVLSQMQGPYSGLAESLRIKEHIYQETKPVLDEKQKWQLQLYGATDARQTTRLEYASALRAAGHEDEAKVLDDEYESLLTVGSLGKDHRLEVQTEKAAAERKAEENPIEYAKAAKLAYDGLVSGGAHKSSALDQLKERFEQAIAASDVVAKRTISTDKSALDGLRSQVDEANARSSAASGTFYGALTNLKGADVTKVHDLLSRYQQGTKEDRAGALHDLQAQYPQLTAKMLAMETASNEVERLGASDGNLKIGIKNATSARRETRSIYAKVLRDAGDLQGAAKVEDEFEQISRTGKLRDE